MNNTRKTKEQLLEDANKHIQYIKTKLQDAITKTEVGISTKVGSAKLEDRWTNDAIKAMRENRLEQLKIMTGSPYFNKCACTFDGKQKDYYFGKFSLPEESIYSWVVPAATIRFENPGEVSYKLPDGRIRKGEMSEKDQYMIVDGKVLFFSKERMGEGRELIHQEHFSSRKSGFMLPEIVSVMEKAQDLIIRAHHKGPFVISGPAGSGKTTLALHRVVYLAQSPETSEIYPSEKMIVFVQDTGTKEYFSQLLPELGIHNVEITTFFEWSRTVLSLEDTQMVTDFETEDKDWYAYQKIQILLTKEIPKWNRNIFTLLKEYYGEIFEAQKKQKVLDRIDITILLKSYLNEKKKFETIRRFTRATHEGKLVRRSEKKLLKYPLMIIDEFQNYMPEQITLMKACLDKETESVVYVGDMAQQVRLGTIQSWQDIDESISDERNVRLHKVYRNTKQILNYIQKLGFKVEMPEGIKDGPEVTELKTTSEEEKVKFINEMLKNKEEGQTVGIICKDKTDVGILKKSFTSEEIHICTMAESQGVEFDMVCLVNPFEKDKNDTDTEHDANFIKEKEKIEKDLLYVALTRAIREMWVIY